MSMRFDDLPDVLTVKEVEPVLRRSRDSIYGDVRRGAIPHRRVGRRILFLKEELVQFLRGEEVNRDQE